MGDGGPAKPTEASAPNPYSPPAAPIDLSGAPAAAAGGFKSALPLANAIVGVMAFYILGQVFFAVSSFVAIGVMKRVQAGESVPHAALAAIDTRTDLLRMLLIALLLAAIVLFCFFMPRANRNARAFGSPMANSPGWAAGWFFIPILYLWKPYYAMKEIWQGSDPDPSVHAFDAPVSPLLPLWWWMYLAFISSGWLYRVVGGEKGPSGFIATSHVRIVNAAITIVAALLAAAVVRQVALRQEERQRRRSAAPIQVTAGAAP